MTPPPLTIKLHILPARSNLVPSPRLIERLNAGLHCKLTLVSTPTGFGKTTLLGEWAARCRRPIVLLTLLVVVALLATACSGMRTPVSPEPTTPSWLVLVGRG